MAASVSRENWTRGRDWRSTEMTAITASGAASRLSVTPPTVKALATIVSRRRYATSLGRSTATGIAMTPAHAATATRGSHAASAPTTIADARAAPTSRTALARALICSWAVLIAAYTGAHDERHSPCCGGDSLLQRREIPPGNTGVGPSPGALRTGRGGCGLHRH